MEKVQNRINALKNLQLQIADAESKLNDEVVQLECKHAAVFESLFSKREKLINGEYEPNEEESKWEYEENDEEKDSAEQNGVSSTKNSKTEEDNSKNLDNFWLKAMESTNLLKQLIHETDRPILKHLKDVKVKLNNEKPYGYTLEFHFGENEFFKNKVLTKTYELAAEKDQKNPLFYNNNSLYKCLGTKIEWNEGKKPERKTAEKQEEDDDEDEDGSFFDFFNTHTPDGSRPTFNSTKNGTPNKDSAPEIIEEIEIDRLFDLDYEIGQFIKDSFVPKALLYFTGDINEEDEMGEMMIGGDMGDSDDDDDDESDEEPISNNKKVKSK